MNAFSLLALQTEVPPPAGLLPPLAILAIGMAVVLGLIIALRANAFLALTTAAIVVSLLAPGEVSVKISRVAEHFGTAAGKIAIVIALASIIGDCMMQSGAADRIVRFFLGLLGRRQAPVALMGSGFVLAVPVFFDTVFYLLVPLARSLYKRTGANYLLYILAITAGGAVTHTLVPPTPGPLAMATSLNVDLGMLIVVGGLVAVPVSISGLLFALIANRWITIPLREVAAAPEHEVPGDEQLPPLWLSILPVALPVLLISAGTIMDTLAKGYPEKLQALDAWTGGPTSQHLARATAVLGNPNLAMLLAMLVAVVMVVRQRGYTLAKLAEKIELSLMSAGVIILITSAGGAFGGMLTVAEVGKAIEQMAGSFAEGGRLTGTSLVLIGFGVAAVLKVAQGSSTVAMMTTAAMLSSLVASSGELGFHPVYVATAIGSGSLIGSWMNDSGFWIVVKMSGMTELEGLSTWTIQLLVLGTTGLAATLVLAHWLPLV